LSDGTAKFNDFQLDALKEVGNVGAGNAATALSKMTSRRIDMSVTRVSVLDTDSIVQFSGATPNGVAAVYLPFYGDVKGMALIFFSLERISDLLVLLTGAPPRAPGDFTEMEKSAIQELGSILSGSYLSALFKFIKIQMIQGVPALIVDMAPAILDTVLVDREEKGESAILIETEFMESGKQLTGCFFLIPEAGGLEKLFEAFTRSLGFPDNG
jgi:chemotaxis protein CheC